MAGLGVNIDHVATIRQARGTVEPDPAWAAVEAELGGADCITFHLRKDRRHINDRDAEVLKQIVRCKLNMEMSLDAEIVAIAIDLKPDQATIVPETREELTTEGGLDTVRHAARLAEVTEALRDAGIEVSAFIDPVADHIAAAAAAGCDAMEIHTGEYANACLIANSHERHERTAEALAAIATGVELGIEAGLTVHGGHGLTYNNVTPVAEIDGFTEFNIGHSIIARAVFVGLSDAVAEMKALVDTSGYV